MSDTNPRTHAMETAFSLPFKDPNAAKKALIGSALILANFILPLIPTFFFLGYISRIMKGAASDENGFLLPEWDDWGGLFVDGLKYFGVIFVFMLPGVLLMTLGYGAMLIVPFATGIMGSVDSDLEVLSVFGMMFGTFGGMALMMLGMLLSMLIGIVLPAALTHLSVQGEFGAAFRVKEWWRILRANLGGFVIVFLLLLGLVWVLMIALQILYLSIVLCCLLPFAVSAVYYYLGAVSANLFGQAYRDGLQKSEPAPPSIDTIAE